MGKKSKPKAPRKSKAQKVTEYKAKGVPRGMIDERPMYYQPFIKPGSQNQFIQKDKDGNQPIFASKMTFDPVGEMDPRRRAMYARRGLTQAPPNNRKATTTTTTGEKPRAYIPGIDLTQQFEMKPVQPTGRKGRRRAILASRAVGQDITKPWYVTGRQNVNRKPEFEGHHYGKQMSPYTVRSRYG